MTPQDVIDTALDVLAEIAPDADLSGLHPADPLQDRLELDSFDFLVFLQRLSDRLGVEIPERDVRRLSTLEGCADYVTTRRGAPA